jgi:glycosyltransferase involved in cell wall biosynthesis
MIGPYPESPERIDGGVAAATMYLSQALASRSDVKLVGARIARRGNEAREDHALGWPVVDVPLGRLSLSTLYLAQRRRLDALLRKYDPHIVHAQGADIAGLLAVNSGRPSVVTVHGMLAECARYQTDPANRLRATLAAMVTERHTIRRTPDLIAISPYVARYFREDIRGRVHEVPNAIKEEFFSTNRTVERGRLLYAGRIANGKGLEELIRAVALNSSTVTKLVLAGATPDSAYGDRLRKLVGSLRIDDRVQFAGFLAEPDLMKQFSSAEALVLPSFQETAPMVVQQAMATGMAVIATSVGGIPYQVQDGVSGLLCQAGDAAALARLIARLASDATLGRRLGDAARKVAVARYRAGTVANSTVEVYRTALGITRRLTG